MPRRYTLTHSDATGELFLTIDADYDRDALSAFQARSMADEVLAEWSRDERGPFLLLHCRAQGGLPIYGTASMRRRIFEGYMPLVLQALRYGDREFIDAHPVLNDAPVRVQYHTATSAERTSPIKDGLATTRRADGEDGHLLT